MQFDSTYGLALSQYACCFSLSLEQAAVTREKREERCTTCVARFSHPRVITWLFLSNFEPLI